ncbi:hypothetical protein BLD44_023215 [Mastigocladus laminosus UU774]|nr:hypothetical protein BLD44_023215 [Mastigocladus laminosus UU774]
MNTTTVERTPAKAKTKKRYPGVPHELKIRLTEEQYERLGEVMNITGDCRAVIIRRAIAQYLNQQGV